VLILVSGGEDAGSKETLRSAIDALQENGTLVYAIFVKGQSKRNEDRESQPGGQRRSGIGFPFPGSGYPGGGYPGSGYPGGGYPGGGYPGSGSSGGNAPSGGRQPQHAPAPRGDARRILEDIAAPTGGRVFEMGGKQDAAAIFAMIQNDIAHGSILAFNPDRRGARPGFHSLRIETRQKDIRVDAPDGFYVKEPE
jgi:VWFA-related protein